MDSKKGKIGWACSTHREMRNTYTVLVGKAEGKRPLGKCRFWRIALK
jgi:hypothetical protein